MNLLCPNCQKMLTVPEEYAGQLMQCPLCRGTFTMPALPGSPQPAPPPQAGQFDIPTPPSFAAPPPMPKQPPARERPAPPPVPEWEAPMTPEVMPPPSTAGGYRYSIPLRFNPRVLAWVVPVLLILVLVLTFFPWVGGYPGGFRMVTQSAWQVAFGKGSENKEILGDSKGDKEGEDEKGPGKGALVLVGLILLCLTVLIAITFIVFNLLPSGTASFIDGLKRWQGLILGGLALLVLLFIFIQMLAGFPVEKKAKETTDAFDAEIDKAEGPAKKEPIMKKGATIGTLGIGRTFWFRLAFWLLLLAALCGFLQFWGVRRGNRPPPKLELAW
jgi:hypothetical protein